MIPRRFNKRWIVVAIIVGLSLYAAGSFTVAVVNSLDSRGGTDLYTYWRINHFIKQGEDPYQAFLQKADVQLPVSYIDGHTTTTYPLAKVVFGQSPPGNSPPILFLLLPLSFLSWATAKIIWMLLSIGLVLATPWIAFRLIPYKLSLALCSMLTLIYYGMPGTRAAIVTGQTAVIAIFLILLTLCLMRSNKKLLAGLALGIALSKFSVAIALLFFLLYKRNWAIVVIGLIVQAVGFAGFAFLRTGSPFEVLADFVSIAGTHASFPGIHLTGLFTPTTMTTVLVGIVFSVVVFYLLWFQLSKRKIEDSDRAMLDYTVFGVLCLWSLLVAYHRAYDLGLVLPALAIFVCVLSRPPSWGLGTERMRLLLPLFIVSVLSLSLPIRLVEDVFGAWWDNFVTSAATMVLAFLLAGSLIFLKQRGQIYNGKAVVPK